MSTPAFRSSVAPVARNEWGVSVRIHGQSSSLTLRPRMAAPVRLDVKCCGGGTMIDSHVFPGRSTVACSVSWLREAMRPATPFSRKLSLLGQFTARFAKHSEQCLMRELWIIRAQLHNTKSGLRGAACEHADFAASALGAYQQLALAIRKSTNATGIATRLTANKRRGLMGREAPYSPQPVRCGV